MLANDRAVRDAILDFQTPAIDALARVAVRMCTNTISVALWRELAEAHEWSGQGYVASPMIGRPDSAAGKDLWGMAAGSCHPMLADDIEVIGRDIATMAIVPTLPRITAGMVPAFRRPPGSRKKKPHD